MKCPNCEAELNENARFCGSCGAPVAPAGSEPPVKTPEFRPPPPRPAAAAPSQRRLPVNSLTIILAILILGGVAAVAFVLLPNLFSGSEQILYIVQDDGIGTPIVGLTVVKADGSDSVEIAFDRDGLRLSMPPANTQRSYLSPNNQWVAYYEESSRGTYGMELVLASIEAGSPLLVENSAACIRNWCGFSPDGRRFAYTTLDENDGEVAVYVVGEKGNELATVPDVIFAQFFPDNERLLVFEYDANDQEVTGLAWVDIDAGDVNRIIRISAGNFTNVMPSLSPDGKQVYFFEEETLQVVSLEGGGAQRVYEFDTLGWGIILPHDNLLTVWAGGELILVDPADNRVTRLDRDVASTTHIGEQNVAVSNDGGLIAYLTQDSGGVSLYVVERDGRNRRRITDDNNWITFALSPNSKQIAYIEGSQPNSPGSLYIADVDGSNRLRLDVGVWSFRFTENGRRIIYSAVDDLERGQPESEIYHIRPNGKDQELLLELQDGLITILALIK